MSTHETKVKVGLVQDSPVFFDKDRTIEKVGELALSCANLDCQLVVFPESFIPGYPRGFSFGATIGNRTRAGREMYAAYHRNSIDLNGEDMRKLEDVARVANIYLVIGVTEKKKNSGSLFCSMLYISPRQGLLGVHRKIKPTASERIVWAEAAGESLVTFQTAVGRLGGLICWENYMPLARMSMYQKGVEIYIAPTADARPEWISTMQHIALEGRCFVLGCNQHFTKSMYPDSYAASLEGQSDEMCRGGSVIVSPLGKIIAGPMYDQAGCLFAELDREEIILSKLDFDINGHYSRDDIFHFEVKDQPPMVTDVKPD